MILLKVTATLEITYPERREIPLGPVYLNPAEHPEVDWGSPEKVADSLYDITGWGWFHGDVCGLRTDPEVERVEL